MQCPNCGAPIAENTLQALETPAAPTVPPSPSAQLDVQKIVQEVRMLCFPFAFQGCSGCF